MARPCSALCLARLQGTRADGSRPTYGEKLASQALLLRCCSGRCVLHRCHVFMLPHAGFTAQVRWQRHTAPFDRIVATRPRPPAHPKTLRFCQLSTRLHMFLCVPASLRRRFRCALALARLSSSWFGHPHTPPLMCLLCTRLTCTWQRDPLAWVRALLAQRICTDGGGTSIDGARNLHIVILCVFHAALLWQWPDLADAFP